MTDGSGKHLPFQLQCELAVNGESVYTSIEVFCVLYHIVCEAPLKANGAKWNNLWSRKVEIVETINETTLCLMLMKHPETNTLVLCFYFERFFTLNVFSTMF